MKEGRLQILTPALLHHMHLSLTWVTPPELSCGQWGHSKFSEPLFGQITPDNAFHLCSAVMSAIRGI